MKKDGGAHAAGPSGPSAASSGAEPRPRRIHVGGLPAGVTQDELKARFVSFGSVTGVDMPAADGLGQPRRFAYVNLTTTDAQWRKCVALYSGSKWRGTTLKLQEAKPNYLDVLKREWAAAAAAAAAESTSTTTTKAATPRPAKAGKKGRKAKVRVVHAADMSVVTKETAKGRRGWRMDPRGRLTAVMRFFVRNMPKLHKRGRKIIIVDPSKARNTYRTRFGAEWETPISQLKLTMDSGRPASAVPVTRLEATLAAATKPEDRWWENDDDPNVARQKKVNATLTKPKEDDSSDDDNDDTTPTPGTLREKMDREKSASLRIIEQMFGISSSGPAKAKTPAPVGDDDAEPESDSKPSEEAPERYAVVKQPLRALFNLGDDSSASSSTFLFGAPADVQEGDDDNDNDDDDEKVVLKPAATKPSATEKSRQETPVTERQKGFFFLRFDEPTRCASSANDYLKTFFLSDDTEHIIRRRWESTRTDLTAEYKRKHKSAFRRQQKQKQHYVANRDATAKQGASKK